MSNIPVRADAPDRSPLWDRGTRAVVWLAGLTLAVYGVHGLWGAHAAAVVCGALLLWAPARGRS